MVAPAAISRVVEKYYSVKELCFLIGFDAKFWRDRAKDGDFTIVDPDHPETPICNPLDIAGELRIPATAVNFYLAKHPFRYDAGVKARNKAELQRKLS
jgi:hypothetical protein